jgi:thiol-disulfide isomerase/thioredoxin
MALIISEIASLQDFKQLLIDNTGVLIIKFGAEWCGPCKLIKNQVDKSFNLMPNNTKCVIVDVDESIEVYAFLKKKRMINGIPAILAYYSENINYIPDDSVSGADTNGINLFFDRQYKKAIEIMNNRI